MINKVSKRLNKENIFHKKEGRYLITKRSKIKIPLINKDIVYLIGVIAGDGSLNKTKREKGGYHYTFRIYAEGDSYLRYLNNMFGKKFQIKGKIVKDKRKKNSYHLVIKNVIIFYYFVINGCEIGKKQRGKIPEYITKNKKYFIEYLSGLVDTDGHVKKNRIQLKQKNRRLLSIIQDICNKINLNCNSPKVNYTNGKPYYYIRFDNKIPLRFKTNRFLKHKKYMMNMPV